jgi:threonine/homoserine/homoserine lactone efflux protein
MLSIFFNSLLIGYSGAIMPGPMLTNTIEKSMHKSFKTGFFLAIGHALFELFVVLLLFIGVGEFFEKDISKAVIGLIGGLFLGYLGFGMLKDVYLKKVSIEGTDSKNNKQANSFFAGILLSATNPYFLIWWPAVGLTFIINSYNSLGILGVTIFYFGHIFADITWFTFISLLVSKTSHLINIKIYRILIVVLALCLIGFGVKFLLGSVQYIL